MKPSALRRALGAALGASALLALAAPALANEAAWPTKPIRVIVTFPPGGSADAIVRAIGPRVSEKLGQPLVIENRPGAGGNIGADYVAKQPADGYTIMITSIGMATNKALYAKLGYDPVKDFAPISLLAVVPNVLVVNAAKSPDRSVKDVVARARREPGRLTYASAGNGTSIHLAGEVFASMAGVNLMHVPYKGSSPAVTDMLGGQVDLMFDSITSARPHIQSGKLRALGVTTKERSQVLPDVPTIAEQGFPGYDVSVFFGLVVPAGTPKPAIDKLNQAFADALKQPEVRKTLLAQGLEFAPSTSPDQLAAFMQAEVPKWRAVVKSSGAEID